MQSYFCLEHLGTASPVAPGVHYGHHCKDRRQGSPRLVCALSLYFSRAGEPGCWRRLKAGKAPRTVVAIDRNDAFKQKPFPKLPQDTKGCSETNPGTKLFSLLETFMPLV